MIKLSDFARLQGVTPRAVQQLVKKYESELEGHFERKGQNGTWLDQTAQEFLRSRMLKNPVTLYDESTLPFYDELQELRRDKIDLQAKLNASNEAFQKYVTSTTERLAKAAEVELALESVTNEKIKLEARAEEAEGVNNALIEQADKAKKEAEDLREKLLEADQTKEDLKKLQAEFEEREKKIQELENRTLGDYLKGLFRKKNKK